VFVGKVVLGVVVARVNFKLKKTNCQGKTKNPHCRPKPQRPRRGGAGDLEMVIKEEMVVVAKGKLSC
jgi:hypothetical protein